LQFRGRPIAIDARDLSYQYFNLAAGVTNWLSTREVQHLRLLPGTYDFHVSGPAEDIAFRVTGAGTIDYDDHFASVLAGKGTPTLTVRAVLATP
jgi:hypothetical protein